MAQFKLPPLPFGKRSLIPLISEETLDFHYGKHHKGYVDKTNALLEESPNLLTEASLEDIVRSSEGDLFNQATQAWNHTFYWLSMTPEKFSPVPEDLEKTLTDSFGGIDPFKTKFVEQGMKVFGSGWVWLTKNASGKLEIVFTSNSENPIRENKIPLLVCDVWEHAYYIDHRNERKKYLTAWIDHINWNFANENAQVDELADMTRYMK